MDPLLGLATPGAEIPVTMAECGGSDPALGFCQNTCIGLEPSVAVSPTPGGKVQAYGANSLGPTANPDSWMWSDGSNTDLYRNWIGMPTVPYNAPENGVGFHESEISARQRSLRPVLHGSRTADARGILGGLHVCPCESCFNFFSANFFAPTLCLERAQRDLPEGRRPRLRLRCSSVVNVQSVNLLPQIVFRLALKSPD